MPRAPILIFACIGLLLATALSSSILSAEEQAVKAVDFASQVQPLLKRACYACHGPTKDKSSYRLDIRDSALKGGESYAPNIIPGESAKSPLIEFVTGTGDLTMPPEGPRLTAAEVDLLRAWIDQGAKWPDDLAGQVIDKRDWWSLKPLVRPAIPMCNAPAENPVDAFIHLQLAKAGLQPSPPADRRMLIRRVYYGLIGLPPTPEEVDVFVNDHDPRAYEKLVDRLLASPRYGERYARHWMDAVHFAETHGHDQDRIREHAWPYRDYLIAAFNSDKPLACFVQEQVAGDVLFPEDPQATAALGFLAAGPWDESSLRDIREDTLDRQIGRYLDRDDIIGTVMHNLTSQTVQCARCHDHKFDAISQEDYYALQAVFSGVERANRKYDVDAKTVIARRDLIQRQQQLKNRDPQRLATLLTAEQQPAITAWEKAVQSRTTPWLTLKVTTASSSNGSTLSVLDDASVRASGNRPERDTYTLVAELPAGKVTALRLEVLIDNELPHRGPGRQDNGNLHLSEIQAFIGDSAHAVALKQPTADFNQEGWDIAKALDGNEQTAWGIYPQVGHAHQAAFELADSVDLKSPTQLRVVLKQLHGGGHLIGRLRLSFTSSARPVRVDGIAVALAAILAKPPAERTLAEQTEVAIAYEHDTIERGLVALPPQSLIYAAASDFDPDGGLRPPPGARTVHLLHRGDIRHPRAEATPGALTAIAALPARFELPPGHHESTRRAALATWLTDPQNPLLWRSMANRIWHHHFGRGLSSTLNDFGHLGETPSHPELLDWLATELRDGNQSLKHLHRLLVTSATYRQTSHVAASSEAKAALTSDADNRLLWRMTRTRIDAECAHDALLVAAGRLDERMGGPSDRQFSVRPGVHVTPVVNYKEFDLDSPAGRRRSVYRFLFRTLPDPFMDALDCPSGDAITPARTNSVTVQQALALWNDAFVLRQCEHLAARVQVEQPTVEAQVARAMRLTLGRPPSPGEAKDLTAYAEKHGLANLCRLLVNSNEFLFVD